MRESSVRTCPTRSRRICGKRVRYVAFISFRHVDPDQRWAKWLHTRLEAYRLPKALLPGRADNRLGRVFRDAEELAACADLPDELKTALADSQYLIVICSPATAGSQWVDQEIREFAALGRSHNILALLVRGEPADAFPPVFKELGIEPLAADVRIDKRRFRNDAELRLLARLIGCKYDDLRQREHERRLRQVLAAAIVMGAAAAAFCVIAIVAIIHRDTARSRELAVTSGHFLTDDAELSVLLATDAVRIRPTDEAEEALRDGLSRDLLRHVLPGQAGGLTRVAFSADGTRLVTAGERGTLQLWNTADYAPLIRIEAHRTPIGSVAFSPDRRLLVTASGDDPVARVWNADSGRLVHELKGHAGGVTHAEFSHDGHSVVTSGSDTTARVWSVLSGEQTALLSGHTQPVNTATFDLDDRSVFTASSDDFAIKWDLATANPIANYGHVGEVYSLVLSPDGKFLATGTRGYAEVLETTRLQVQCELIGHDDDHEVFGVRFSSNGKLVATAGTDGVSLVADLEPPRRGGPCPTVKLVGHTGSVNSAAFASDGRYVITVSDDHTGRLWDAKSGRLISKLLGQQGPLTDVAVSPDGQFAATASADGSTRIWQLDSAPPRRTLSGARAAVAPVGSRVLTWSDTDASLWDIDSGQPIAKLAGPTDKISEALFSRDGSLLMTIDGGAAVHVWNPADGKLLHEFRADTVPLSHGAFSRDARRIAVASNTGLVRIWDLETEKLQAELRGHSKAVNSLMFNDDGRRLVTASDDGTVRIWDTSTGSASLVYRGHRGAVTRATFTPDGAQVISVDTANQNATIRNRGDYQFPVWNAQTGKNVFLLSGHTDYLHDVVMSPDGTLAVSVSEDTTADVWSVKTGIRLSVLSGHQEGVTRASFSADGKFVATTGGDCSLRVWDALSGRLVVEFGEDVGCFDDPQFSAGNRSVIASSIGPIKGSPRTQEVAILPCELCLDQAGLLALARSRLSRDLTPAERVRYLK